MREGSGLSQPAALTEAGTASVGAWRWLPTWLAKLARRHPSALGLVAYLLLAVVFLSHAWFGGDLGQRLVGQGGDPMGLVWFLDWLPHALGQGHSPFFTTLLMAPQGANLLDSTSISLPSLVLWPTTAAFGPVFSYNLLATLALALSAWTAYFALRRITEHRSSAWIGGALYGFGGYMAGQATSHVNLLLTVFPPLVALLLDDVRRGRRPVRTGLALGLCAAAQVFVNEEILATTAILTLLALLVAAWLKRPTRAVVMRYVRALTAAAFVFVIVAGPALIYQQFGPQAVHGSLVSSGRYVNDLAGFVIPNRIDWLSTAGSRQLTGGFSGFDGEYGSYLGLPLIALLVFAGWRLRRRALSAGLLLIGAAVLSLGPHLRVLGHDTGIFLPWVVPGHLPLLENVVPARLNLYVWLAVAALVVLLIDDLRRRPLFGRPSLGWALCSLALIPVLPALTPSQLVAIPPVAGQAATFRQVAPQAKTALITPFTNGQLSMYAQAKAGFSYRIPDGGVFVPQPGGAAYGMRNGPLLYALATLASRQSTTAGRTPQDAVCLQSLAREESISDGCRIRYVNALEDLGIDTVIVTNIGSQSEVLRYQRFFSSLLGPPLKTQDAWVFAVRPRPA